MDKVEQVIIGAGVVGCAIAYELSQKGFSPLVFEKGPRIAEGVTSRNSGVIHAGLYYKPSSLKAQSCIRGNALLYEWCQKYRVPFRKTGKWVVGSLAEEGELEAIHANALESGATGLHLYTKNPKPLNWDSKISADIGMYSSETGIVDPYEFSYSLYTQAEQNGAQFILNTEVKNITCLPQGGYELETSRGLIQTEIIFNAAGLYADEIAALAGITKYKIYPYRGDYFFLRTPQVFSSLVYPIKKKGSAGLGIHLTIAIDGSYRLGPDVSLAPSYCVGFASEFVACTSYAFSGKSSGKEDFFPPSNLEEKKLLFYQAACQYLQNISLDQLQYDSCGLRPKLRSPQDKEEKDFVVSQDLPGFINLVGIESPGLTASLDLAQRAVGLLV